MISCAVTGSIHTPSLSPYPPLAPRQIADEAVATARAGAAVLRLHARDPKEGSPSFSPDVCRQFLPETAAQTDAIVVVATDFSPAMASCNMGSLNFG